MGSITLVVEKMHEFNPDERERTSSHIITRNPAEAKGSKLYRLHRGVCWDCGARKPELVHRQDVTMTFTVADCVEEMFENGQKADSREFDVAEETKKRGWTALAVLSHISNPDRQGRACLSEDDLMQSDVNWSTARTWFEAVEDAKWCTYSAGNLFFGSTEIILFDPTHPWTAEIAERIGDTLGPDSGNVVLDEDALEEAKADAERENLTSGYLRQGVPMTVDVEEVRLKMRELDDGHYERDQDKLVTRAVQQIPHQFDEGFDEVEGHEDEYLCVCGLREVNEIHHGLLIRS